MYQYFDNQADIAWAILEENFETQKEHLRLALERDGTGYERIAVWLSCFLTILREDPEQFRFLLQFDVMYASEQTVDRLLEVTQRVFGGTVEPVARVVRLGIEDGSLRSDLDPAHTASVLGSMAVALASRLASQRASVIVEYGRTPEEIFADTCQLVLQGMRAP